MYSFNSFVSIFSRDGVWDPIEDALEEYYYSPSIEGFHAKYKQFMTSISSLFVE